VPLEAPTGADPPIAAAGALAERRGRLQRVPGGLHALQHQGTRSQSTVAACGGSVLTVPASRGEIHSVPASQDNQFPALDWQRYALRRMVRNYLTVNRWLADQLRLARFARVPGTPTAPPTAQPHPPPSPNDFVSPPQCATGRADSGQHRGGPDHLRRGSADGARAARSQLPAVVLVQRQAGPGRQGAGRLHVRPRRRRWL